MAHPLESSYHWRTPVGVSTVALSTCLGLVSSSTSNRWVPAAVLLVGVWAAFLVVVYVRTRAYILVDGPILRVRRYRRFVELDGRVVVAVREYPTAFGPCYKVWLQGEHQPYRIPSAMLQRGHSALFDWVLTWSDDAQLDKGARRTVDSLRSRGLLR